MSRETDSSSSGPQGHGGPGYAPGTEPYGTGAGEPFERPAAGADAEAPEDEPKTETTMTTRVRINIPGSRPIPPLVMREPVGEEAGPEVEEDSPDDAGPGRGTASGAGGGAASPESDTPVGGAAPGSSGDSPRPTSDWFAPRKPPRTAPEPEPEQEPGRPRAAAPPDDFPSLGGTARDSAPRGGSDPLDGSSPRPSSSDVPPGGAPTGPPLDATTGPQTGDMSPPSRSGSGFGDGPAGPPPGPGAGYDPFGRPMPSDSPKSPSGSSLYEQGPGTPGDGRITSDTLVSGVPRVPSVDSVFPPDAPAPRPTGHGLFDDDRLDAPSEDGRGDRGDRDDGYERKSRSKLVLAAAGLVGVLAVAYGTGLLLDHSDVPKGTTVLGVEIGGTSEQDASNTLDAALDSRMTDPLTLVIDGKKQQVTPEVLGLTIDIDETVRQAAGRDYNPVSVIGSLFGGTREVPAQVQVDDDKLRAAVDGLSREALPGGAAKDGMVVFTGGTPKVVPGEPHRSVDVDRAVGLIEDAFRERAASGSGAPVTLPVSEQKPKFGEKQLQAAADEFGSTAMSGWVWVQAGDVELPFSEKTIGTFLTIRPAESSLQPHIDLDKLAAAYGSSFEGVVIDGGAGTVPVQPKHIAAAMVQALREPAPELPDKRVAEVTASRSR
ncbi:peptidoglycan binding domain-containing protein [Streptomyces sp. TR06-5]|uniref:peptidoglycan binding domain-containing protein n=1 Tax=unclassified Streptomyces TaxID=2593676 RepID=UPI0039A10AF1